MGTDSTSATVASLADGATAPAGAVATSGASAGRHEPPAATSRGGRAGGIGEGGDEGTPGSGGPGGGATSRRGLARHPLAYGHEALVLGGRVPDSGASSTFTSARDRCDGYAPPRQG